MEPRGGNEVELGPDPEGVRRCEREGEDVSGMRTDMDMLVDDGRVEWAWECGSAELQVVLVLLLVLLG